MQAFHSKVTVGLFASVLAVLTTTAARADDPRNGGYFQLRTSDGYCLGMEHDRLTNGTQMEEATCHPTSAASTQAWWWSPTDCFWVQDANGNWEKYCTITTSNNKCLGTYAGSGNQGTYAVIWDCLGTSHTDQYWSTDVAADGTMKIWNGKSPGYGLGYAGTTSEYCGFSFTCYHYQVGLESAAFQLTATPATP